jgi:hypothetical protein
MLERVLPPEGYDEVVGTFGSTRWTAFHCRARARTVASESSGSPRP